MSRVAVVTGAASGIGAAVARRLAEDGFAVAALDVADPSGDMDAFVRTDVTDADQVDRAFAELDRRFGRVDLLVNNAGVAGSAEATCCHLTPVAEWDRVFAVNVRGSFLCARAALGPMLRQGAGHILSVASVAGLVAFPQRCAYTASKGAVVQLTKSLAADYAALGVRANAICPGMVDTPMTRWRLAQPDLLAQVEARIPLGRVAEASEIADAVALLASERLGHMTGNVFVIDGGWTAV